MTGMETEEIAEACTQVRESLASTLSYEDFEIVDSKSWFDDRFSTCGSWDAWVWETVHGRDFATRNFHFSAFVALYEVLGRANAGIVRLALEAGRLVFLCSRDGSLRVVTEVATTDENNWKSGWSLVSAPIGE